MVAEAEVAIVAMVVDEVDAGAPKEVTGEKAPLAAMVAAVVLPVVAVVVAAAAKAGAGRG